MIISDLEHMEQITEASDIKGGFDWSTIMQSLSIYPAASSAVNTLGGHSIGNTVTTMNISMPIFLVINYSPSRSSRSRFNPFFLRPGKSSRRGFFF
ncbi:hypothetical protein CAL7716_089450 [Calothrix sp. PCC 7716]|nr:hypothetical protein CAL7716_089450 [Calothrix sp. PCC 7716]